MVLLPAFILIVPTPFERYFTNILLLPYETISKVEPTDTVQPGAEKLYVPVVPMTLGPEME